VLALLVAATLVVLAQAGLGSLGGSTANAAATPYLPFDLTTTASSKLVFAHYVPWFPASIDNRPADIDYYTAQYLNPAGERGVHASYGGFLRDRPSVRVVSASADWRLDDMKTDVARAIAAGIDGFAVDVVSIDPSSRSWANVVLLLQAARAVSPTFRIVLQPDMTGLVSADPVSLARAMASLAAYPAAFRTGGKLVVSPFFAEKRAVSWWSQFLSELSTTYTTPVSLFPVLNDDVTYADDFAPISIGVGNWGSRNPAWNSPTAQGATSPRGRIASVHARGDLWVQPVSVQDERPRSGIYDEAANTTNLRGTWQVARDGGADWVLLATWNDWAEGTAIAPSLYHGYAYLDLMAYYIAWFKTGTAPSIVRDGIYLTHRRQPVAAAPQFPQTTLMRLRGGTPAQDTVEALTFLTDPATVDVEVGGVVTSCAAPAGVSSCVAPLRAGLVAVSVVRDGVPVASVTSPAVVYATPFVQDLQYVAASSLRNGGGAVVAAPVPSTPVPVSTSAAPVPPSTPAAPPSGAQSPTAPSTSTPPVAPPPTPSVAPTTPAAPAPTTSAPMPSSSGPVAVRPTMTMAFLSTTVSAGQKAVVRVTFTPSAATGVVRLVVDGDPQVLTVPVLGGTVTTSTPALAAGTHTVQAWFEPATADWVDSYAASYTFYVSP
jgi:hypothetical protein